mmetsp:Transcript_73007/g.152464  ORF Transcript_73007/g.152464 Transcript_73007/m.152464 type:complete len:93 (+) Transcript_73007:1166-1444(+)
MPGGQATRQRATGLATASRRLWGEMMSLPAAARAFQRPHECPEHTTGSTGWIEGLTAGTPHHRASKCSWNIVASALLTRVGDRKEKGEARLR